MSVSLPKSFVAKKAYGAMVFVAPYLGMGSLTDLPYADYFYEINRGLAGISVNLNVDGSGSATINVVCPLDKSQIDSNRGINDKALLKKIPFFAGSVDVTAEQYTAKGIFGDEVTYYSILDSTKTECIFKPMDKIQIYLEGRFQSDDSSNRQYFKSFDGLIMGSSVAYSGGDINISIQCRDLTEWLAISIYNVNPGVPNDALPDLNGSEDVTTFTTNLAGLNGADIVKKMVVGSKNGIITITEDQYTNLYGDTTMIKNVFAQFVKTDQNGNQTVIPGFSYVTGSANAIKASLAATKITGASIVYKQNGIKLDGAGFFSFSNKGSAAASNGTPQAVTLGTGFNGNDSLWIDPGISNYPAYSTQFKTAFDMWNHQFNTRLNIISDIKNITNCEFYMDRDGLLVFKPPYYNSNPGEIYQYIYLTIPGFDDFDVSINTGFKAAGDYYLIEDKEIIDASFIEDANDVKTYVTITGQADYIDTQVANINRSYVYDLDLIRRFGFKPEEKSLPFAFGETAEVAREIFGKGLMNRMNSNTKKANISISMRPELRLGYTIALVGDFIQQNYPMDFNPVAEWDTTICNLIDIKNAASAAVTKTTLALKSAAKSIINHTNFASSINFTPESTAPKVYYISAITHNWTPGQGATTQLTLTHGRRWDNSFGFLMFTQEEKEIATNALFDAYVTMINIQINIAKSAYIAINNAISQIPIGARDPQIKLRDDKWNEVQLYLTAISVGQAKNPPAPATQTEILAAFGQITDTDKARYSALLTAAGVAP